MKKIKSRAYSNIALVKYWGKENEELIIPKNNSLSLTLKALSTETIVYFISDEEFNEEISKFDFYNEYLENKDSIKDIFYLDGKIQDINQHKKITKYIDIFRKISGINKRIKIESLNNVPTAAGLASSASGFAALAMGLNKLFDLNKNLNDVSKLARRGSGSASRSIFGGLVEWEKGFDDETSFAIKIDDADWDIAMIILVLNSNRKKISSRDAMKHTLSTSPFYESFVKEQFEDIKKIKEAIKNKDFEEMGKITEHNAMKMHATMLSANPPFMYFEEESIFAINKIKELRKEGYKVYYTMDAGPNVKILCRKSQSKEIIKKLSKDFDESKIIYSEVGKDASVEVLQ